MAVVVVNHELAADQLAQLQAPRDDLVLERAVLPDHDGGRPAGALEFELEHGPFHRWRRALSAPEPLGDGRSAVTETVDLDLAVPFWSVLFTPALKHSLRRAGRRPGSKASAPWWAPPGRLDARASTVLALLSLLGLFAGYMGTLLTQTNTFFREDFGASEADIGWLLGLVRIGALGSLAIVAIADRRGRRRALLSAAFLGCVATAATAAAPNLVLLGVAQTFARSFAMAVAILVAIVAVEEMPSRSRAWALSALVMAAALGAGQAVIALPLAGIAEGSWRLLFLVPLLALWPIVAIGRRLPETRRFEATRARPSPELASPIAASLHPDTPEREGATRARARAPARARARAPRARLLLLAASALLLEVFTSPAAGFLNEHLRTDRGFSAAQISLFTILTNTPAGIGVVVGGRLADVRGRRVVGAIGVAAGVGFTVLMYMATGWAIWAWSLIAGVIGAAAIPALGVYAPELFPTGARGRANGIINLARVGGSAIGLIGAGLLADRLAGGLSSSMAVLAIAPAIVVVLVLVAYPETKGRELEDINPTDAPISMEMLELESISPDVLGSVPLPPPEERRPEQGRAEP